MMHLPEFILHHWELWIALAVILVLLLTHELQEYRKQTTQLSPQDAVLFINQNDVCILDARSETAYQQAHISKSIHVKKEDFSVPAIIKYKNKPLLLICELNEASHLAKKWKAAGFTQIHLLAGGIDAWRAAGFPLTL